MLAEDSLTMPSSSGMSCNPLSEVQSLTSCHGFFFSIEHRCMAPDGGGTPDDDPFLTDLNKHFGSVNMFKQLFSLAALEVFGSGWAWLVYNLDKGKLEITSTANQDTPAMQIGVFPILGLDVWEHAYYLKHQASRKNYIEDFWHVINWKEVSRRYEEAIQAIQERSKAEL